MRTVRTAPGAPIGRLVLRRGTRQIEHLGSAHDDAELEALKAAVLPRWHCSHMVKRAAR